MRRRAIAIATFSLPWKYLLAMSEFISIFTSGSQSTSSVHSQTRLFPSLLSSLYVTLTTRSRSGNSKRCGVSASRSFGPMSGSSLMSENVRSMTSRNSFADLNPIPFRTLHERRSTLHEVLVHELLDRVAHALRDLEHGRTVVGGGRVVPREVDRLAELDPPLRRQRDRTEGAEQRERRGDREVRRPGEAREQLGLPDLRVDLLAAHDGDRHDRRTGAQRYLDEAAAAEALQSVTVPEVLAGSLHALGEDGDELVLLEQADRVVRRRGNRADLAQRNRHERQLERPVQDEEARIARQRVLLEQRDRHHRPVPRQDPSVVRDEKRAAVRGNVLRAGRGHAPPALVHELEQRVRGLREPLVETPLVLAVIAAQAAAHGRDRVLHVARERPECTGERAGGVRSLLERLARALEERERRCEPRRTSRQFGRRLLLSGRVVRLDVRRALAGRRAPLPTPAWRSVGARRRPVCLPA